MIEKYIKTAEHLRNLKNFQTMFAVVAGLSSPFVSRLSQSWAEVSFGYSTAINLERTSGLIGGAVWLGQVILPFEKIPRRRISNTYKNG